jgi:hypothetical protein
MVLVAVLSAGGVHARGTSRRPRHLSRSTRSRHKAAKQDVRRLLKACVEWFNTANDRAGGVIATEEREDICAALEEMAYVARQPTLMSEVDRWRAW